MTNQIEQIKEEKTIKSNTLHKDNRVIRVKQLHKQGKEAKLLNNFLYREAQLKINFGQKTEQGLKYNTLNTYDTILTIPEMRKILGLQGTGRYIELIEIAIEQLKKEVIIYNYRDKDGEFWENYKVRFINFSGEKRERKTGEKTYTLGISEHMYKIIRETKLNKNFTQLNLDIHTKLTSKGIEIYEWLKSYQNMKGGYCAPLNLTIINDIFFTDYEYISKARTLLMNNIAKINEKTDLVVREVIKDKGKRGEIYLQVQESTTSKKDKLDKKLAITNQKRGQEKQSYKVEKDESEEQMIANILNKG